LDAFHSKHAKVGPSYIQCTARYNGDDGFAINGHYHIISYAPGTRQIRVIGKLGEEPDLVVGDEVELVSYNGERVPNAKITAIEAGSDLWQSERNFLNQANFAGRVKNTRSATSVYYVTLNRAITLPIGSLIASANRIGNGFLVQGCTAGPNRSRGILVKASNGSIINNVLVDNWGMAIKASPEFKWLEAGSGNNITITGNTITKCHDVAIAVHAENGDGAISPVGAHNDVKISGNSIVDSSMPAIAVTSTKNLDLTNNIISGRDNDLVEPWRQNQFGRSQKPNRKIFLKNVA